MCELMGFSASKNTDISEYLRAFFSHSPMHPHGWGLMLENGRREVYREPVRACDSKKLAGLIKDIAPQKNLLAHIRYATVGSITKDNCHPFTASDDSGREWTLIHNGTIFDGKHNYRYSTVQTGDTDSERFFLAMLDKINAQLKKGVPAERARFDLISRFVADNAPRNKLNLMIYDGDLLYVHKNLKNTLSFKQLENGIVFATAPLDDGDWRPFPMTQVIAFRSGEEVYRGDRHNGVFVPTFDHINTTNAMYI